MGRDSKHSASKLSFSLKTKKNTTPLQHKIVQYRTTDSLKPGDDGTKGEVFELDGELAEELRRESYASTAFKSWLETNREKKRKKLLEDIDKQDVSKRSSV